MPSEMNSLTVKYYATCVLDVLGQRRKLAEWMHIPSDGQLTADMKKAVGESAFAVQRLRRMFKSNFTEWTRDTKNSPNSDFDAANDLERARDGTISIQQFSDTLVFYSPLLNARGDLSPRPLFGMMIACGMTMLAALALRLPFRAGIAIGIATELGDQDLYGPVLAEAHHLESNVAGHPRVVIADSVIPFIERTTPFSRKESIDSILRLIAGDCSRLLAEDHDGVRILDYVGPAFMDLIRTANRPDISELAQQALAFVSEQAEAFRRNQNPLLAMRYWLVCEYLERRRPHWYCKACDA